MLQSDIIDTLMKPQSYGLDGDKTIGRFDTHISIVFLAGEYAYKLKRAIRLPFVDFRNLEDRKHFCEEEIRVNQLGAPGLYLDVVPVCVEEGGVKVDGKGQPVEWLVRMKRFDQEQLFDCLCEENKLTATILEELTDHIFEVYEKSEVSHDFGGAEGIKRAFEGHYLAFDNCPETVLPAQEIKALKACVSKELGKLWEYLEERQKSGLVRSCHGDLHLRNICFFEGRITLFDAIEFEPDFAVIDVFYDLSFLLMDLLHRDHSGLCNAVMNRYVGRSGDVGAYRVMGLFLASRAAIRTHVNAVASANQKTKEAQAYLEHDARSYLKEALAYLDPKETKLVAIGGFSGAGKSVLAKKLAPAIGRVPGAYIARTDMIRKRLMGAKPTERLGEEGYSRSVTQKTYHTLYAEIHEVLNAGYSVIVDGVFAKEKERKKLEAIAQELKIPFIGFWLEAPLEELCKRADARRNDVSDATGEIVRLQHGYDVGALNWHKINSAQDVEKVYKTACEILSL